MPPSRDTRGMREDPLVQLRRLGGVASRRRLLAQGVRARDLARAVEHGLIRRIRRGWYASPDAPAEVVTAVRIGGRLSCVSALRIQGAWTLPCPETHVRVARGVAVRRLGRERLHYDDAGGMTGEFPLDDPLTALRLAIECCEAIEAIVVLDSCLNRGMIRASDLDALCSTPRGRALRARIDGRAESGLETIARLRLRARGVRVRTQVAIAGVGRVDLVIGDRLVLEVDGERWHGDFERDRDRDRALVVRGYLVIRASYRQVMDEWDRIEAEILTLVRRRAHRWRASELRAANSHATPG